MKQQRLINVFLLLVLLFVCSLPIQLFFAKDKPVQTGTDYTLVVWGGSIGEIVDCEEVVTTYNNEGLELTVKHHEVILDHYTMNESMLTSNAEVSSLNENPNLADLDWHLVIQQGEQYTYFLGDTNNPDGRFSIANCKGEIWTRYFAEE